MSYVAASSVAILTLHIQSEVVFTSSSGVVSFQSIHSWVFSHSRVEGKGIQSQIKPITTSHCSAIPWPHVGCWLRISRNYQINNSSISLSYYHRVILLTTRSTSYTRRNWGGRERERERERVNVGLLIIHNNLQETIMVALPELSPDEVQMRIVPLSLSLNGPNE